MVAPLLLDASGQKMGKTEGNSLWLDPTLTDPFDFYQYWVNVADADVGRYLRLFTFLPREEIEAAIGRKVEVMDEGAAVIAPGMLASHYAPNAGLRLNAREPRAGEAFLAFGPAPAGATGKLLNLSPAADLHEAARNLFAMLHELDETAARIAVAPIPATGLGEAINDRLKRAAAPRIGAITSRDGGTGR